MESAHDRLSDDNAISFEHEMTFRRTVPNWQPAGCLERPLRRDVNNSLSLHYPIQPNRWMAGENIACGFYTRDHLTP